jgi:2-hydroxychromene-2-carboxylate isomerase
MTVAADSIVPTVTTKPDASSAIIDAVLAGPLTRLAGTAAAAQGVTLPAVQADADHPLKDVTDVVAAGEIIGRMLAAEHSTGKKSYYPRALLRQQHIAAFMLVNPFATTTEICAFFGISPTTLGNISKSDTFKALVNAHKVSIESGIGRDIQEQLRDTLAASVEVVQKAVVERQDPDYALAVLDKTANRLGMGAKHNTAVQINNNIVTPEMIAAARARRLPSAS